MIIAETDRILLRVMEEADAAWLRELNDDPEVIRYTGDLPFMSVDEAGAVVRQQHEREARDGMSRWAMILRATAEPLGWCGLRREEDGVIDLGYRLFRRHWGRGYATEAARACVRWGFTTAGLEEITGKVMPENAASRRVLEKAGLLPRGTVEQDGLVLPLLALARDAWQPD